MSHLHPIFFLLSALSLTAQTPTDDSANTKIPKKPPAISLLPDGSVLKGVLLPRYDENRKLIGTLKAQVMTLVDRETIEGQNVIIRLYQPDQTLRGQINFTTAKFNQATGQLTTHEPIQIAADRLRAHGIGLDYSFQEGKGFLRGPATTWIKAPQETAMHTPPRATATAILATALAHTTLIAAPPAFVTPAEMSEIQSRAASQRHLVEEQAEQTQTALSSTETEIREASHTARTYLVAQKNPPEPPPAQPLDVKPGPTDTTITCDDGMYFDSDGGILVYLGNVKVTDPRFELSGANELKIFFEKKAPPVKPNTPDKPKQATEDPAIAAGLADFGDVQKIIATGAVRFLQKPVGDNQAIEASGGLFDYDVPRGQIIISQRYPWVKQGNFFARAQQPNLTLRILNNGSFSTQGNWQMGGNLNLNR